MADRTTRYYAIRDPHDPQRVTYWRRTTKTLSPWPPGSRPGPWPTRAQWNAATPAERDALRQTVIDYHQAVRETIEADPTGAMARYAVWSIRCCVCNRALTDPDSTAVGIGPDCRTGLPPQLLAELQCLVGELHARVEDGRDDVDQVVRP